MDIPELPRRIHILGEEAPAVHSISYHTCWPLHTALKKALHDDEYEELKESKLGVFIKFQELRFVWASRLVHYMLGFQLDIKKKYELWSLVGPQPVRFSLLEFENLTSLNCEYIEDLERPHCVVTKELTSFWEMLGVHVEAGPSTQEIIAAFERCEGWSRDDRKRLAYLAIFTGYIEGRKYSTPTREKKMDIRELPRRIHTLGEEPHAVHSISYHTCWTLHTALKKALHDDEYEELKESKLGVFIKFQEMGFDWVSRLVHYMLGFQLDIKKKYELWSLVGPESVRFSLLEFENLTGLNCEYIEDLERPHCVVTKELTSFWEMLGVHVEAGPSTQEIIAAFERCEGWSRDDRKRLAYLAIFTGYIEGRKYSTPTRVSLARLVMELERFENYPWGRVAFKVLMDSVKGRDISGCYTINGFAQALQVWVYTALPELGATFGNPLPNNPSPRFSQRRFRRRFPSILSNPSFSPPVISPPLSPSFSPPFSQPLPLFKI
ncbi:hypothetical protein F2Q68_00043359 [Brassica cretica]|uniref:DUF1985 domain-containing protein n=1 Tax=Brassica cretica TaxID=69181 RepID=A0A8S9LMV8_BRACR|nr:hypothetical protein F2Q68_00043359 [Brassica cretica]